MKVLIACEFSGIVRSAFSSLGHDAYSADFLPTEIPGNHLVCDVKEILHQEWDLMIAHPPCTYLTNAGVQHLHSHAKAKIHGQHRWRLMEESAEFFNLLHKANIPRICIENPIPHKYARELIGNYTQIIQPWMFGEKKTKATCLWLKNLPLLQPTKVVGPPPKNLSQKEKRSWHEVHYQSPGPDRWKNRSRFYRGIAEAMAQQWGSIKL